MRLRVPNDEALSLLATIPHKSCLNSIPEHWHVTQDDEVSAQSACWLFCWAKTGMNSPEAAAVSLEVFDRLLPVSFTHFDQCVPHDVARKIRYASGDFEMKLASMLS